MRLNIPRITRPLLLTEYAPQFVQADGSPAVIHVWVNPPREFIQRHETLRQRRAELRNAISAAQGESMFSYADELLAATRETNEWFAELWSQHSDTATHWTVDEVRDLLAAETDPLLYEFLVNGSVRLINEHRLAGKKK